jgi:folate-dependent phosphoribosylglycinamide formyltransferase PurN
VNGTRIISKEVLNCVDAVFINMHAGITPKYRGAHGAYWALYNKDRENAGVTIHLVDEGIDTGNIIYQSVVPITEKDNFATYPTLQTCVGVEYEVKAINDIANGKLKTISNDLPSSLYDSFDVFLAGIHKLVLFKVNSYFPLGIPNLINATLKREKVSKKLQRSNTKAYVNAIKLNPIDVITHLNFCAFADALEVAKVASDYGTYLELNAKKEHLTDQELCDIVAKTNVQFVIGSDAHTPDRVGEIELVRKKIERVNLPLDRIANIDGRLPNFRFKAFKEGK